MAIGHVTRLGSIPNQIAKTKTIVWLEIKLCTKQSPFYEELTAGLHGMSLWGRSRNVCSLHLAVVFL